MAGGAVYFHLDVTKEDQWQAAVAEAVKRFGRLTTLINNAAIINISSLYGLVGSPGSIAYHATKGAVRIMSRSAAIQYSRQGVRGNTVFPCVIKTPILGDVPDHMMKQLEEPIPMGRRGNPEDIANASLFLCSDEAQYVTGAELVVDGGSSAI